MIVSVGFGLSCILEKVMKLAYLSFKEVIQEEKGFKYFYVLVCKRVNFYTHSHCWEDNQNTKPLDSNTHL